MLLCELLQLLYYSFSFLCNFGPICNIVIYFQSLSFKICNRNKCCVNKSLFQKKKTKKTRLPRNAFLEKQLHKPNGVSDRLEVMSEIQATLCL